MIELTIIFIVWFALGICAERFLRLSKFITQILRLVKKPNRLVFDDYMWSLLLEVIDTYVDRSFDLKRTQALSTNGCPFFGIRFTLKETYNNEQLVCIKDRVKLKLDEILKYVGKDWETYAIHTIKNGQMTIYVFYSEYNFDKNAFSKTKLLSKKMQNNTNVDTELSKDLDNIQKRR